MTSATGPVAVVLAAGAGSRFVGPTHKLDAMVDGRPIVAAAIDHAIASDIGPVVVVTSRRLTTPLPESVVVVVNDRWAEGQMSSLRCGLVTAEGLGATQVVVGLGDQPFVEPSAWRAVAAAGATSPIAVATYASPDGSARRGHPVSLAAETWSELPDAGDEGARTLMRLRPDLVIEVPCQGSPLDIDTMEDLDRWQNNSSTSSP